MSQGIDYCHLTTAPVPALPALNAKDGAIPQEEGPEKGSAKKRGYLQEIHAMQSAI